MSGAGHPSELRVLAPPVAGLYTPVVPERIYDSRRSADGALAAGDDRTVALLGRGGVQASGVSAVVVNVTGAGAVVEADVQVFPTGRRAELRAPSLHLPAGPAVAALVTTAVGDDGTVSLSLSAGRAHVVLDVVGWYGDGTTGDGGSFRPLVAVRVHDARPRGPRVRLGDVHDVEVLGRGGVPTSGVAAVVVNTTAVGSTAAADVQLHPTGRRPALRAPNLHVAAGETRANLAVVEVGEQGRIRVSSSRRLAHLAVDVVGWYGPRTAADPGLRFTPVTPVRSYDSRTVGGPVSAGVDRVVPVVGREDVPETAEAVVASLTVVDAVRPADVQLCPTGHRPAVRTANVSVAGAAAVSNLAVVGAGRDGAVTISSSAGAPHVVLDVVGWFGE